MILTAVDTDKGDDGNNLYCEGFMSHAKDDADADVTVEVGEFNPHIKDTSGLTLGGLALYELVAQLHEQFLVHRCLDVIVAPFEPLYHLLRPEDSKPCQDRSPSEY